MKMKESRYTPRVSASREFIEISNDFANPLEIVREAISNSFDADAKKIKISFEVIKLDGEEVLQIVFSDDGTGMNMEELKSFFDLGNSTKHNQNNIGEKGHGTKVYFNSSYIEVATVKDNKKLVAKMETPKKHLYANRLPEVQIAEIDSNEVSGTEIKIISYNNNRMEHFSHDELKDYIYWFTKFGSPEKEFGITKFVNVKLFLKGLGHNDFEELTFGHIFPEESKSIDDLFSIYEEDAPAYFCKKFKKQGNLPNFPHIHYDIILYVEGTKKKYDYNPMIRHRGYIAPQGAYTIEDRYGIWLCKDFIPIQRKNNWISTKSEYTRYHAFLNCQHLNLTANRGSVENTPAVILADIKFVLSSFMEEIEATADWQNINFLEKQSFAYKSQKSEKSNFSTRLKRVKQKKISMYKGQEIAEPNNEQEVVLLFTKLDTLDNTIFPFSLLDYDTHNGLDALGKMKQVSLTDSSIKYIEFKNILDNDFNHSFDFLHSIVCWDIKNMHDGINITDLSGKSRTLEISYPQTKGEYTRYFLNSRVADKKIEIFVLKTYLKEKLGLEFQLKAI